MEPSADKVRFWFSTVGPLTRSCSGLGSGVIGFQIDREARRWLELPFYHYGATFRSERVHRAMLRCDQHLD
jgi:hypothetical protein